VDEGAYQTERLDHLGIVAEVCRESGLAAWLDAQAPHSAQQVSIGTATVAMVLNGLGLSNRQLYLVPPFFATKPVALLLGEGVTAEGLNDDCLGRTLDWIAAHDPTRLFAGLASKRAAGSAAAGGSSMSIRPRSRLVGPTRRTRPSPSPMATRATSGRTSKSGCWVSSSSGPENTAKPFSLLNGNGLRELWSGRLPRLKPPSPLFWRHRCGVSRATTGQEGTAGVSCRPDVRA